MNILALDLGTCFGFAWQVGDRLTLDSEELATPAEVTAWNKTHLSRRCDPRFLRFRRRVEELQRPCAVVVFEDVLFCNSRCQCHLWATWRAAIWSVVPEEKLECVPTATLKLFATGNGGCGKGNMAAAMRQTNKQRFSLDGPLNLRRANDLIYDMENEIWLDDNAVDAFWLLQWAKENVTR